jgi:hypothetical protein
VVSHILFIVMLNVIMLNVKMLNVNMLSVSMLSVSMLTGSMLGVTMLSVMGPKRKSDSGWLQQIDGANLPKYKTDRCHNV